MPTVDLEANEALFTAFQRVLGKALDGIEPVTVVLTMVGAGIGRQSFSIPAKHGRDRHVVFAANKIPERDVEWPVPHVIVGPQLTLKVVIDFFAPFRISP